MEDRNVYTEDNSTLTRYLFSFCLYLEQDSIQNCTSVNFSSLSQQSRNYLLTALEESSHQRIKQGNNTVDISSPQLSGGFVTFSLVFSVTFSCIILLTAMFVMRVCLARRKRWNRNSQIVIPSTDIATDENEFSFLMTDDTMIQNDIELCTVKHQLLSKDKDRISVETFGKHYVEYDLPSKTSDIKDIRYQKKDEVCCNTKEEVNADPMSEAKNENNVHIHTEAAAPNLLLKRNDTALNHNVMKCEVMHVKSPGGRSNQADKNDDKDDMNDNADNDDDNDDNAIAPVERSNDLQKHTDKDISMSEWDLIFLNLATEIIDPKTYVMFFIALLAQAGCTNSHLKIAMIQEQTGKSIALTIFNLLHFWKRYAGSKANVKDIEDAFKKLKMNREIDDFRSHIRHLPKLAESTKWHEPLIEASMRQIHSEVRHDDLFLLTTAHAQNPIDFSVNTTEETIVQQESNVVSMLRRRRNVIHNKPKKRRLRKAKVRKYINRSNGRGIQLAISSNSSLTPAPFTSVSNSESGYSSCSYETAMYYKDPKSSNGHKRSASDTKRDPMTHETRQKNVSLNGHEHTYSETPNGHDHNESEKLNEHEHTKSETQNGYEHNESEMLNEYGHTKSETPNGHEHNQSEIPNGHEHTKNETLNGHKHNISETLNEHEHKKSQTVIGHESCTGETKHGHEHFTNETQNGHENKTNKTLIGHAHHANEALTGHEEIGMPNQTSVCSCKSTSSSWCVSSAKSNTLLKNLLKESNEQNRKRHIPYTDSNPLYPFKRRKKSVENPVSFERKYKNAARQNRHFLTHLVELVHHNFESKVPVDLEKYDIFINYLLNRLAERPQKDDIISLRLQSFVAVNCFTTHKGEIIGVIGSENHLLLLREKEWKYLNTYVKYARPIMKKKQPDLNTDFLFLCYDGTPLEHAQ